MWPGTLVTTAAQGSAVDGGATSLLGRLHRQAASYLSSDAPAAPADQEAVPPSPSRVANLRGYLVGRWSNLPDTVLHGESLQLTVKLTVPNSEILRSLR
ncbi:PBAN-type neuropeptides [Frankliniella fusca]|uniref:PBAN-type neuropeptides n=1 Tax=Frankliniella fusca TaxID=407009 RepID=A0AAE1LMK6_9NEOP|nr:PBAN-type neuropeptides [Frankliniella fusca]